MNVIFVDFDGVISTFHHSEPHDWERRIILLAEICKKYDCKVVIESTHKDGINEETLEVEPNYTYVKAVLELMKKHGIEVIGRTPELTSKYRYVKFPKDIVEGFINDYYKQLEICKEWMAYGHEEVYYDFIERYPKLSDYINERVYLKVNIWKEDEIRIYLMRHPEIEHYVILDDDDLGPKKSDLNKVRDHLVLVNEYDLNDYENEGLLPKHEEEIANILKKENKVRSYVLRMNEKRGKTR